MIGPGTGVAPFISFLKKRSQDEKCDRNNTFLFFGNRFKQKDFLHKNFLTQLQNDQK